MALPLVTLHFAQSLDGRLALGAERERALLSTEEGIVRAHRARAAHDAVLVGIDTLLADDPLLTLRSASGAQPLRVVLDSTLRTPCSARLLRAERPAGQVMIFACRERACAERRAELEAAGATVCSISSDAQGRLALPEALAELRAHGVERLLVEGGARVLTSFVRAGLAQRAEIEIAPVWLGAGATPTLCELGVIKLSQAFRLARMEVERLGDSVFVSGEIAYPMRSQA